MEPGLHLSNKPFDRLGGACPKDEVVSFIYKTREVLRMHYFIENRVYIHMLEVSIHESGLLLYISSTSVHIVGVLNSNLKQSVYKTERIMWR